MADLNIIAVFVILTTGASGAEWASVPDPVVYTCKGKAVSLTWKLTEGQESNADIRWFFHGAFSSELVAAFTFGEFLTGKSYSGRVSQVQYSGIKVKDVRKSDEGNYTITVLGKDRRSVSHTVLLQVGDGMMTRNRVLEAVQDPVALWDTTLQKWIIRLLCGHFLFWGKPPVRIEWTLPNGEIRTTASYDDGQFSLALPASLVPEGNYTCRIPRHFYPEVCIDEQHDDLDTAATVYVDEIRARLTLSEAEQGRLTIENSDIKDALKNVTAEMHYLKRVLYEEIGELQNRTCSLSGCPFNYSVLDDARRDVNTTPLINTTTVISFNVDLSETKTYNSAVSNIVWDRVVDNSGHIYNLSTGRVTAPRTGRYYFAVTTVSPNRDRADVDIMVNGSMLCRVTSQVPNDVGSCQGIRHMAAGDQAWVQAYNGTNTFKVNASSFTGFLLAGDASRVSFTVRTTSNKQYNAGDKLTWDRALDNYGQTMNLTTGTFTAKVTGQYFFAVTTTSPVVNEYSCAYIMADGVTICGVCSECSNDGRCMGSCQGTARLAAGRTAWVQSGTNPYSYMAEVTTFSGFLVSGDHGRTVSYTATLTTDREYSTDGQRVVWDTTTDNAGGGYDNNTGHFTAPVAGHYLLAVTTQSYSGRGDVEVVTSGGQTVCRVDSDVAYDTGSCQGVVRLDRGQQVWVETLHCPCGLYSDGFSVFTGFLIQPATL